jgi:hypothetical protein
VVERRPVLRVFISSTATDLTEYRDRIRDSVLRLEHLPIAMETLSAQESAIKLPYLALRNMSKKWQCVQGWREALRQFTIRWPERIELGRGA